MCEIGDIESVEVFDIIYNDEKGYVVIGVKWFCFFCVCEKKDLVVMF